MADFKVIIIGGSVAGLTLANVLQQYGIDFIVLEKYHDIAPQLGASIGVLPYGSQILDQIGANDGVEKVSAPVNKLQAYGPDASDLGCRDQFGNILEQLTGYRFNFLDRRELIQALYDTLEDKSKVLVDQGLVKIEQLEDSVTVTTKDGTQYTGNFLVGADGVHSRTRDEIWRIADSEDPTYPVQSMADSMKCTYRCMFGISDRPEGMPDDQGYKTYKKNRSYLYQGGKGGKLYFFAFMKNPEVTVHQSIPKYTIEDEKATAAEFGSDVLLPGLTFGDVYKRRRNAVLTPLQEYVLERCFYKRAIVIGDAFHKFNPLTGQGGNSAIEDAGLLGDLLKEMLDKGYHPTNGELQSALSYFERKRRPRAQGLMAGAHFLQSVEALENPLLEFLNLQVMSKAGILPVVTNFASMCSPGYILKYLPRPSRQRVVALDVDVIARPRERSPPATALWAGLMIVIAGIFAFGYRHFSPDPADLGVSSNLYTLITTIAINGMWTIESYRPGVFGGPLHSALLYVLASTLFGWEFIFPIYAAIFIFASRNRPFYYPNPRIINPQAAENLPTALAVTYIAPVLLALGSAEPHLVSRVLTAAHLAFPVLVFLGQKVSKKPDPSSNIPQLLYGTRDMPYLFGCYAMLFTLASLFHLFLVQGEFQQVTELGLQQMDFVSQGVWKITCLTVGIMTWCIFTIWDLKRTNILRTSVVTGMLGVVVGTVLVGPAGTLIGVWAQREWALEDSRRKK